MRRAALALAAGLFAPALALADELPIILDKPFIGNFVGFGDSREYEFGIGGDGTSELFFKKNKKRLSTNGCSLHIYFLAEEKEKGRWVSRKMMEKGFSTAQKETEEPPLDKPIAFTATFTGETKVEIAHTFTRDGVEITTRLVEKKTKNPVRVGVRVMVGDMYRHVKEGELDGRELKKKVGDTDVTIWPVGGKKRSGERIDFHDLKFNLQETFPKGATRFALESDRIGEHEYILSTANEKYGTLMFRQRKPLLHGFYVDWYPDPAKIGEKDCRLVITVK